ncbi:MAG TPA: sigma-70 family RNA polymerase sigma factor [Anaerolineaceae bacterium]|nr:sigma-70 family RNA polymerase sigma factor [Anaerolineaceae bacterium]HOS53872.1 sigma-70 family RNA polymerase sigma factor [Anaerolineaceae bacterium]HPD63505.1 sigma-70 family RNA polymerase sigma factor [Anaerolineaceae bacterium]HQF68544.1 sigma-70 family RNA polymerase sigma factor [Anaerolineaceae bacterium]HRS74767.1 sigma-70 family RNA polymerase sigma factor [Anaerolineaceae bacterium]
MKQIDPIWIERARHGDEEAFTMLVEAYQTPVFNLCYRMLGESTAAEDAAQETFWRVWQKIKSYDPQRSFSTWVLSIAAHYCIDQQRKQKITIFELDEYPDFDLGDPHMPNPEITVITNEEEETLHRMINQLNPPDRAAVILKYWYGCSEEEISQMLSLTVSAVKSRLHRARRQLAEVVTKNQSTTLQRGSYDEALSL